MDTEPAKFATPECLWDKEALAAAVNDPDDDTRTMGVLADILAADLYRRTTGIR